MIPWWDCIVLYISLAPGNRSMAILVDRQSDWKIIYYIIELCTPYKQAVLVNLEKLSWRISKLNLSNKHHFAPVNIRLTNSCWAWTSAFNKHEQTPNHFNSRIIHKTGAFRPERAGKGTNTANQTFSQLKIFIWLTTEGCCNGKPCQD